MFKPTHEEESPLVNFMLIGVQKSGTTALANFLMQHPDIYLPPHKEVHLFDAQDWAGFTSVKQVNNRYLAAFENFADEPIVGEATPIYLYWGETVQDLYRYNPQLKIIVLLRDPVDRAVSHYSMEKNRDNESRPLFLAILLEPYRLWKDRKNKTQLSSRRLHSYVDRSRYSGQLDNLFGIFPKKNVLLVKTEELKNSHQLTLRRVFQFLGARDTSLEIPPATIFSDSQKTKRHRLSRCLLTMLLRKEAARMNEIFRSRTNCQARGGCGER